MVLRIHTTIVQKLSNILVVGGDTVDGRMRLDYEACKVGTKLNLWVKTHKETLKESHARDGWCSN